MFCKYICSVLDRGVHDSSILVEANFLLAVKLLLLFLAVKLIFNLLLAVKFIKNTHSLIMILLSAL